MDCQEIRGDLRESGDRPVSALLLQICVKIFVFSIGKYNYMCYYIIVKRKYL